MLSFLQVSGRKIKKCGSRLFRTRTSFCPKVSPWEIKNSCFRMRLNPVGETVVSRLGSSRKAATSLCCVDVWPFFVSYICVPQGDSKRTTFDKSHLNNCFFDVCRTSVVQNDYHDICKHYKQKICLSGFS